MRTSSKTIVVTLALLTSFLHLTTTWGAEKTGVSIVNVYAVDQSGNTLTQFKSGQYVRIHWKANYNPSDVSSRGSLTFSASAVFSTKLLGKTISYNLSLGNIKSSGIGISEVSILSSDSDQLTNIYQYEEYTDLLIPEQTPSGDVTIKITAKSSLKNFKPIIFSKKYKIIK